MTRFVSLRVYFKRFTERMNKRIPLISKKEANKSGASTNHLRTGRNLNEGEKLLVVGGGGDLQDGEEGFLGDVDLADALHAFFSFFLFF